MSNKVNGATKSVMILTIFSIVSKILGFLRETLIANRYGSGSATDSFVLALSAIAIFSTVITSTVGTTLIPVLSEVEAKEGKQGKIRHLNNFLNIIMITAASLVVIAYVGAPLVLKLIAPGVEVEQYNFIVLLTRIGLPSIFFSAIIGVFRGYLQSEGQFKEFAFTGIIMNVIIIIFLIFLSDQHDVRYLMAVYVLGQSAPLLLQIYVLKGNNYNYEFVLEIKDEYMKRVLYMMPPLLIGVAIADINAVVNNSLASGLVQGSVSALNYARKLDAMTTGIFVTSLLTVIFPMLSSAANKEDRKELKNATIRGLNTIILIMIPAAVGMIVLAEPIVTVAFQRGKFDAVATQMTTVALMSFSVGVTFSAIRTYLYRVFYSIQDTKTPVLNSGMAVLFMIIFSLILVGPMKHAGIALATSLSHIFAALILVHLLIKKLGSFGFKKTIIVGLKSLSASLAMGFVAYFTYGFLFNILGTGTINMAIALFVSVLLGVIVYFVLVVLFKVEELSIILDGFKRKLKK